MNRSKIWLSALLLGVQLIAQAQHQELGEQPAIWEKKLPSDSAAPIRNIADLFRKGTISGHFRSFYLRTDNQRGLSDYDSWALGGGIKLQTAMLNGFQAGISGFFIYNLAGSDLGVPDPSTQQPNRYEIGLYDVEDPSNKSDLDRLEELYIKYQRNNISLTLGKQLLNTPFINLQDGRMRPTEAEGLWAEWKPSANWQIRSGLIYGMSPRGTVRWYSVEKSIGVYSMGVTETGVKSDYAGQTNTRGIFLNNVEYKNAQWKIQLWNQYTEQLFNSLLLQVDRVHPLFNGTWFGGAQWIRQDATGSSEPTDPTKQYVSPNWSSNGFGFRSGWKNKQWETSLNYTRITKKGRYLMPREWGRDPFFTFMPRERNEGLGDVHAVVFKVQYQSKKQPLQAGLGFGHYQLPDVLNYRLNKYGMPSYRQFNADLRYRFKGIWKGLDLQLLYVHKQGLGDTHGALRYVINKVNMSQWNGVLNFQF